jgi:hypothetical protein
MGLFKSKAEKLARKGDWYGVCLLLGDLTEMGDAVAILKSQPDWTSICMDFALSYECESTAYDPRKEFVVGGPEVAIQRAQALWTERWPAVQTMAWCEEVVRTQQGTVAADRAAVVFAQMAVDHDFAIPAHIADQLHESNLEMVASAQRGHHLRPWVTPDGAGEDWVG